MIFYIARYQGDREVSKNSLIEGLLFAGFMSPVFTMLRKRVEFKKLEGKDGIEEFKYKFHRRRWMVGRRRVAGIISACTIDVGAYPCGAPASQTNIRYRCRETRRHRFHRVFIPRFRPPTSLFSSRYCGPLLSSCTYPRWITMASVDTTRVSGIP